MRVLLLSKDSVDGKRKVSFIAGASCRSFEASESQSHGIASLSMLKHAFNMASIVAA